MNSLFRIAGALTLVGMLGVPAVAQPNTCADTLAVGAMPVCVNFHVLPGTVSGKSVTVHMTFSSGAKTVEKNVTFEVVPGAAISRTIDDTDISAIAPGKMLHNTLRYTAATSAVSLDRSLLLPGAIPLK